MATTKQVTNLIWFEKYRPKTIADMSLPPVYKGAFEKYIEDGSIPHLLLEGSPGSGKTTIAHILISHIPSVALVLNASGIDRGVDTVKTKITQFASSMASQGRLKIVFLDEADFMTKDAQAALKNTMETYSKNCRFILTCNDIGKVIDPIQSRCTKYTFSQFPKKRMSILLSDILEKEGIEGVEDKELMSLIDRFFPDVRSIINNLQAACATGVYNSKAIGSLQVDPREISKLILEGKFNDIRKYLAGTADFTFLYKYLFNIFLHEFVPEKVRAEAAKEILEYSAKDTYVADRENQFAGCMLSLMIVLGIKIIW